MNIHEENIDQDIRNIKKRAKLGCLIWTVILTILFVLPIVWVVGRFIYDIEYREYPLVVSHSPNNINTIEIVEVGGPYLFGPSRVRIKYESIQIKRILSNRGASISKENVIVDWESDYKATITLFGDEQEPDIIEFTAKDTNNEDKPNFRFSDTD